jgi:hypothetical protein
VSAVMALRSRTMSFRRGRVSFNSFAAHRGSGPAALYTPRAKSRRDGCFHPATDFDFLAIFAISVLSCAASCKVANCKTTLRAVSA